MALSARRARRDHARSVLPTAVADVFGAVVELPEATTSELVDASLLRSRVRRGDILARPRDAYDKLNGQVVELLGFSRDDLRRDPPMLVRRMHPDDRRRYYTSEDRLVHTQRHTTLEHRFLHKDGDYRWIRRNIHRVEDGRGNLEVLECRASAMSEPEVAESQLQSELDELPCGARTFHALQSPGAAG